MNATINKFNCLNNLFQNEMSCYWDTVYCASFNLQVQLQNTPCRVKHVITVFYIRFRISGLWYLQNKNAFNLCLKAAQSILLADSQSICSSDTAFSWSCSFHQMKSKKFTQSGLVQWRRRVFESEGDNWEGDYQGPKGCSLRPEGPKAGVGFLQRGQPAPSPPARGSGGAL